jgi:hypothetical protein
MSESISEQDVEFSDLSALEEVQEEPEAVPQEKQAATDDVEIPKKFEGKSMEDVVKSYTELEKEFGRRNNEVGELRKLTDQLLGLQLAEKEQTAAKEKPKRPNVEFDSLVENPNEAIDAVVGSHPKLKELEEKLVLKERQEAQAAFESKHNDWKDLVNSEEFRGWVSETKGRQRMFLEADSNYDYELADELFSMYKSTKGEQVVVDKEAEEAARDQALKDAASEKGTSGQKATKVFRRSQLIQLKVSDPAKYQSLLPEIELAYQEGRVR